VITGFLVAGLICIFALVTGRVRIRDAAVAALVFATVIAVIEISSRLVSGYVSDIILLLGMNSGSLMPRIFQALSINFGIAASLGLLILVLTSADRSAILSSLGRLKREKSSSALSAFADRPAFWLVVLTVAGIVFESQNTGSQAMIFVWPVLLCVLKEHGAAVRGDRSALAVLALVGAVYLPPVVNIVERAARAYVGTVGNVALAHKNLGTLGSVNARPQVISRAETMAMIYANDRPAFERLAARDEMPSSLLYSDFDFQILYLMTLDNVIDAIRALETQKGVRFESIMALDFANPAPWLMGRRAPASVTVGSDPYRAVPPLDAATRKAVGSVDLALLLVCPPTPASMKLERHFAEPLSQHRRVRLTQCYDGFLHPRFQ
jgi:hypothetical protein